MQKGAASCNFKQMPLPGRVGDKCAMIELRKTVEERRGRRSSLRLSVKSLCLRCGETYRLREPGEACRGCAELPHEKTTKGQNDCKSFKKMVGTRRLELLTSTVSTQANQ